MAAAAILDFEKCAFLPKGSMLVCAKCMLIKFGENRFIFAETINIFRNSRWRPPPSWILENLHFSPHGSILASARCTLLKFGENCFIFAETINILRNSRWRPPPSWILENVHFFNQRIDFCGCRMYAVEIWRELLYICGNYQHFSKLKMAAATILDF